MIVMELWPPISLHMQHIAIRTHGLNTAIHDCTRLADAKLARAEVDEALAIVRRSLRHLHLRAVTDERVRVDLSRIEADLLVVSAGGVVHVHPSERELLQLRWLSGALRASAAAVKWNAEGGARATARAGVGARAPRR